MVFELFHVKSTNSCHRAKSLFCNYVYFGDFSKNIIDSNYWLTLSPLTLEHDMKLFHKHFKNYELKIKKYKQNQVGHNFRLIGLIESLGSNSKK